MPKPLFRLLKPQLHSVLKAVFPKLDLEYFPLMYKLRKLLICFTRRLEKACCNFALQDLRHRLKKSSLSGQLAPKKKEIVNVCEYKQSFVY